MQYGLAKYVKHFDKNKIIVCNRGILYVWRIVQSVMKLWWKPIATKLKVGKVIYSSIFWTVSLSTKPYVLLASKLACPIS